MFLDARHKLFLVLAATFTTCLLVGDIIGGKLIQTQVFGFTFTTTVGMIPFPVTFLLTDVLNEFYGKRAARFVTWLGFWMAVLAFLLIAIAGVIPMAPMAQAPGWKGVTEAAFSNVFLGSQRMLIASLVAYIVAQFVDIAVFHLLKQLTGSRFLWLRATGSTAVSQLIDTAAITAVAWVGILSTSEMLNIVLSAYVLKLMIAVGLTPLVYLCHGLIERGLQIPPVALGPKE
jgi:uncharacterized integral membrane protein (TIGR00697 family)